MQILGFTQNNAPIKILSGTLKVLVSKETSLKLAASLGTLYLRPSNLPKSKESSKGASNYRLLNRQLHDPHLKRFSAI
jgi:hypothetical protein